MEIERSPGKERVKKKLKNLPKGLSELYTNILRSSEARLTDDLREFAQHLYLWMDVSDYKPGFLADDFDSLPQFALQVIFKFVNSGDGIFNEAASAREIGHPLIEIHD